MDERVQATHPTLLPEISKYPSLIIPLVFWRCRLVKLPLGNGVLPTGCHELTCTLHYLLVYRFCHVLKALGSCCTLRVSVRAAQTPGEAPEFKAPRSWWQSSQQEIHTSNPASPLLPHSHTCEPVGNVIVCLCSKG